jgi:hypothetical protein
MEETKYGLFLLFVAVVFCWIILLDIRAELRKQTKLLEANIKDQQD